MTIAKRRRKCSNPLEIERRSAMIANTKGQVRRLRSKQWSVASQSIPGREYDVSLTEGGFRCECSYHTKGRHRKCKHIAAVEFVMMREAEAAPRTGETKIAAPTQTCPKCRSGRICKDGIRRCKRRGPVQRFRCHTCGRRFSGKPGFEGRHFSPKIITASLAMFAFGLSPGKISQIWEMIGTGMHPATVQRWADRYVGLVEEYVKGIRPQSLGRKWCADEKYKKVRGLERWVFTVMDEATRFILSFGVSPVKQGYDATPLLETARKTAGFVPRMFVTDGLQSFATAFKKVFWTATKPPIHIREIHLEGLFCNTNVQERFNGELACRFDASRGLKREDSTLIRMAILHHNFIRTHSGLGGKTPAEAAGIITECPNRWLTLIQNAALAAA